jgi:lipoprotein-anchoring transpeptidase ErfK/SrfK
MVDTRRLRRELLSELRDPRGARWVRGHLLHIRPRLRKADLRRAYPTYVSVSRGSRIVRLFKRLRRVRTYRVAVGAAGYATPAGLHRVQSKQVNPTWYVPNRAWAGSLAGQVIGPSDPRNPLKARFIALGGGVGFHGTADLGSIGQAASHGCIRMRVPDVINLYNRVSVGTPVLIR